MELLISRSARGLPHDGAICFAPWLFMKHPGQADLGRCRPPRPTGTYKASRAGRSPPLLAESATAPASPPESITSGKHYARRSKRPSRRRTSTPLASKADILGQPRLGRASPSKATCPLTGLGVDHEARFPARLTWLHACSSPSARPVLILQLHLMGPLLDPKPLHARVFRMGLIVSTHHPRRGFGKLFDFFVLVPPLASG